MRLLCVAVRWHCNRYASLYNSYAIAKHRYTMALQSLSIAVQWHCNRYHCFTMALQSLSIALQWDCSIAIQWHCNRYASSCNGFSATTYRCTMAMQSIFIANHHYPFPHIIISHSSFLQLIGGISPDARNEIGHTVLQTLCSSADKCDSESEKETEERRVQGMIACAQELIR
jgi:hypothetical protein